MDFCEKCGGVMIPQKKGEAVSLVCRSCGHKTKSSKKVFRVSEKIDKPKDEIVVIEKEFIGLPVTKAMCPECENSEAFWWLQQTRAGDEAPTLFLRCTKCNHSWREYS
jgi:DNA-directed RNA polymerase subunit M